MYKRPDSLDDQGRPIFGYAKIAPDPTSFLRTKKMGVFDAYTAEVYLGAF